MIAPSAEFRQQERHNVDRPDGVGLPAGMPGKTVDGGMPPPDFLLLALPCLSLRQTFVRLSAGFRQAFGRPTFGAKRREAKSGVFRDVCCVAGSPAALGGCLRPLLAPGGPPSSAGGGATIALRQGPESHKSVGGWHAPRGHFFTKTRNKYLFSTARPPRLQPAKPPSRLYSRV